MKYHVMWTDAEVHVSTITFAEAAAMADKRKDWKLYSICRLPYTPQNKAEMKQHAEKIAAYFEEVDTAKEAVIRCTKI
jgi:cytochrome c1